MPAKSAPIATILGEQYSHLVKSPWSPAFEDISACLEQLDLPQLQRHILETALHMWYLSRRYPKTYKFSIGLVAKRVGITPCYCAEQMKLLARIKDEEGYITQEHDSPLLVLVRSKNGAAYRVDPGPLLALPQNMARYKRSHKVQRGGLTAQVAEQERAASAPASMEQEQPAAAQPMKASSPTRPARPKRTVRAAQPTQAPGQQEQQAPGKVEAPALPEQCIAVLVAFLDAQELRTNREKDIAALVALTNAQRAGLDDSALLVALQRATAQASADIARRGKAIASPFGLLTHKIKEAIAQQQQELADQARRMMEQEQEAADMLAALSEAGQHFYDYGSAHDWPVFTCGRIWSNRKDWLDFAFAYDDETILATLARIEAPAGAAQEQPAETDQTVLQPIGPDEATPTPAPAISAPTIEAPDRQELPTAPTTNPFGNRVNSRKEVVKVAACKGYPAIRISGYGMVAGRPDTWERFSNNAAHKDIQQALRLLGELPDRPVEAPAIIRAVNEIAKGIDRAANSPAARWVSDSAAGLL